ncbi:MAG: hypothetical protein KC777_13320 [Cyanobacteria bacterium HKST-UBA02]|nr:hypothetical protein [Cyanobacteria bacterium HKST-UBA02]
MSESDRPEQKNNISPPGFDFNFTDAKLSDVKPPGKSEGTPPAGDLQIAYGDPPQTRQEKLQEFVDGFGKVGKLYSDSVQDNDRFGKFQDRMAQVYSSDRDGFLDLARVGKEMTDKPPASPEKLGEGLADAIADKISRMQAGGNVELDGPEMMNFQGAVAGMMLAARSTFEPGTMDKQTVAMVDALDARLQAKNVPYIRGIIWGDTHEPGLALIRPGTQVDRHNYL